MAIDYDELAKKHGGTTIEVTPISAPTIDFDKIATELGGTATVEEEFSQENKGLLQKISEQFSAQQAQNPLQAFSGSLTGAAKEVGSAIFEAGKFGAETLGRVPRAITGQGFTPAPVFEKPKQLEAKGLQEKSGMLGVQAAEFIAPSKRVTQAQEVLKLLAEKLPSGLKGIGKLLGVVAPEAVTTGAVSKIQGQSKEEVDRNILIASGVPIVGRALAGSVRLTKEQAPRVINSLIKPLLKDFSYGKNPGEAIAKEGIIANSLEELGQKVAARRKEIGGEISNIVKNQKYKDVRFDISKQVDDIFDDAISNAQRAPQTNEALISRLNRAKSDLSINNLQRMSPEQLWNFKQTVGEITKWTGNQSDDQLVNATLKKVYGISKENLNRAFPALKEKNELYANLLSAEIATVYRDKIASRLNLLPLGARITGYGSAVVGSLGALASGNVPAFFTGIAAGASAGAIDLLLSSPAVKTRVATWLAKTSTPEQQQVFNKIPLIKESIQRVFGGDKLLKKKVEQLKALPAPTTIYGQPFKGAGAGILHQNEALNILKNISPGLLKELGQIRRKTPFGEVIEQAPSISEKAKKLKTK